ncbi:CAAX amino terminal protease self- immunity [Planctopirus ephydatiae]|uniref:CAAX amino terminal protease self-immunity n=1 Tax=Planctopirus ephydatiae TaxID=2528019 RepID=A0A518GTI2_9PLAN|nr:CPBP family intramembrane glutamic endopeptidase [Planctopirus ephydatiae]QDV31898.1 CAAX amino terminal protease self- immunity [Planctopirus ephydatiae]
MSDDLEPASSQFAQPVPGDMGTPAIHPVQPPLSLTDFLDEESAPPLVKDVLVSNDESLPAFVRARQSLGPGLGEAVGWTAGVFGSHLLLSIGLLFIISIVSAVYLVSAEGIKDPKELERRLAMDSMGSLGHTILVCGEQWLMVGLTIVAIWLRMGKQTTRQLNLDLPHPYQLLIVTCLVLPLGGIADLSYRLASIPWDFLKNQSDLFAQLDQVNMVEQMQKMTASIPLPLLILAISVSPAISEELVFRGLLVRGLLARWGVLWTMLISSFLFALIHFHPLHVMAVFPIGMALFWIYYTTRNFWLPMWLHLLNNLCSILVMRWQGSLEEVLENADTMQLVVQSGIALLGTSIALWLLHKNRTRYVNAAGDEWNPPAAPMSSPPVQLGFQRQVNVVGIPVFVIGAALTALLLFAQVSSMIEPLDETKAGISDPALAP